ncbi:unnamed protein product, partial [Gulo gulo]
MMTVEMAVTRLAVFTLAWIISSDVLVADASQDIGPVMVTMTVETSVMKPKPIVPGKRFVLLLVVTGMNFGAILMEIAFLICGAVMGKKIVKMVAMKKAAMGRYDCVIIKPNFPVGVQGDASTKHGYVMEILIVKISQMKMIVTVFYVDHPSTLVLTTLQPAFSQRNSATGKGTVQMGLMKAISVVLHV